MQGRTALFSSRIALLYFAQGNFSGLLKIAIAELCRLFNYVIHENKSEYTTCVSMMAKTCRLSFLLVRRNILLPHDHKSKSAIEEELEPDFEHEVIEFQIRNKKCFSMVTQYYSA